ncbi:unnamed protein product [Nyctereutes procyonoides]|uniref:(raccoon dog) hypothetical protein n=1 Tax=Nyctereutes procyonoides TaxID=34880 RepID=A0A811YCR5_NYCPR|nr:unnamed protein product [Nyctereutes procyonoides]
MDMDMSPLRPQIYLVKEEDVKLLSISGKQSNLGSGSTFPRGGKIGASENDDEDEDDDDDDEDDDEHDKEGEAEEKGPVKKKGSSFSRVEAKFINYVKSFFQMTDQEVIQDLWQWRKSLY